MISTGNSAAKSSTASNDDGSSWFTYRSIVSRTSDSSDATARGVKTRLTSLRIRSCSGGSKLMMIFPVGTARILRSRCGLDHVERDALGRREGLVVPDRRGDIVVAGQAPRSRTSRCSTAAPRHASGDTSRTASRSNRPSTDRRRRDHPKQWDSIRSQTQLRSDVATLYQIKARRGWRITAPPRCRDQTGRRRPTPPSGPDRHGPAAGSAPATGSARAHAPCGAPGYRHGHAPRWHRPARGCPRPVRQRVSGSAPLVSARRSRTVWSAPSRSALFTTTMSATSSRPALAA